MNLLESDARAVLLESGIPVPSGQLARSPEEAAIAAAAIGGRLVIKAQIRSGGRGKAGGVRFAGSPAEAAEIAASLLGSDIRGEIVRSVLVAEAVAIEREFYLAFVLDRTSRSLTAVVSLAGGVDIEATSATNPSLVSRFDIDPLLGLADYQCRSIAATLALVGDTARAVEALARRIWKVAIERDATLVEINPLALTRDGRLVCLDAKMVIDDYSLGRQPWTASLEKPSLSKSEVAAGAAGLSYVALDGDIGCVVNGAGLAMATLDVIGFFGGRAANFLDIGGGARSVRVAAALRILLGDKRVRAVLFNIFGGITRCDEVAIGILSALAGVESSVPIVARLEGTAAEEARVMLQGAGVHWAASMDEGAQLAVELANRGTVAIDEVVR